jgi:CheY-like chemotaxis protein
MAKPAFRVLLADDDQNEYVVIRDMLAGTNTSKYDLDWVGTYEDGLKAICQSKYDVVLIDYPLGERNGLELLNQVIERDLNVAAIFLTCQGEYRVNLEAMDAGASDYIDKGQINTDILDRFLRYSIKTKQALSESKQHYRFLFDNILNGYAHCRMLFEQDRPQDVILLSVNNAFKNLTGLKDVVGKKISEVISGIRESNPELFEVCGRVSLSGIPEKL